MNNSDGKNIDIRLLPPETRLKKLTDISDSVQIDINTPAIRYIKSGQNMVRHADMLLKDQHYEDAFKMYMKYVTLFVERIRHHPGYKSVSKEDRIATGDRVREVMPKAEELKVKLLSLYAADYEQYLAEKKNEEKTLLEKLKREENEKRQTNNFDNTVIELSEGIRKNLIDKEIVKPVPYLPDDFLIYEMPDNSSRPTTNNAAGPTKPGIDRSTKPNYISYNSQFSSSLRTIIIPSKMIDRFLVLAQRNTDDNVETCGILAGKLKQNRLVISHLLIPKQYGTSDSCTTDNEEDLFNYQNEYNLITLGWIHTHPSQTAFLSSVDLHTHYSYQLMMSEAIAIVCAPRYSQTGFFRLTPNYGLDFIANCQQKGFHPHPSDPPLFQDAEHFELDENAPVDVVDLRR